MTLLVEEVTKSYPDPAGGPPTRILDVPRYQLAKAEQAVLLGASGGGKTTLLNVIAGLTTPDSGRVEIGGVNLTALPEASRDRFRAQRIGYVFQTFHLLSAFTALENVLLGMSFTGRTADRHAAAALLERVGLSHRSGNRPSQLSVGERQRVAVARALASEPMLMLADEPTANVDVAHRDAVLDLIRETCSERGVALLLVTHDREAAARFDRVEELGTINRVVSGAVGVGRKAEGGAPAAV
ncbi:ABC transporter ATP-binding protein [Alienimonas californiensis]|uniref:Lipoprotein-releasing system ATP-binding protein LolD n=1 Tax=Alienimonas californiensis TaxID=2527989 RepID=A0A517P401_9PLAN|nr:ABC transporter ATP-binding protein [Alienimonas californiensis]QDT14124.1 Lipoprotein-releasing system ATP-binding protein LolD [Alienimonas californiensis]